MVHIGYISSSRLISVHLRLSWAFSWLKSKGNRNFLLKSSFRPKFLFLLKETETNFCLFGFGLAETESLLQISVVNRNFGRNLVSSEPQHKIPCMMVLTISCLHLAICHSVVPPPPIPERQFPQLFSCIKSTIHKEGGKGLALKQKYTFNRDRVFPCADVVWQGS